MAVGKHGFEKCYIYALYEHCTNSSPIAHTKGVARCSIGLHKRPHSTLTSDKES